ncbi:MAG: hypothetical protein ACREQ5_05320 [Candidatus Dormibacteria bacterium]
MDFDTIKLNLISYLKSQNVFSDYAFTGSAMNQLLNVLAYNTHYLSVYLNMAINESFIDTAVLTPNIISHAKLLGYTPRSSTAAQATVNVAITKSNSDATSLLTLPKYAAFSSELLNGVAYNFVTTDSMTVANVNNVFTFANINIKEGAPVTKTFAYTAITNPTQLFQLNDSAIDTSTVSVIVQTSVTNPSQNTFILATDATQVTGMSNVFYLDQDQNGNYQVYFGNGILGTSLNDGNIVTISYVATSGDAANALQTFKLQTQLLSGSTSNTTTIIASAAGSPAESGDSIRFMAPKSYLAQNRAVTINDYITLINKNYPYFQAVTAWGGEQVTPPVYGIVYISAKPLNGFAITEAQKQYVIQQVLQPIGVLTVVPQFVDADYNFLNFRVTVHYNPTETNSTASQMSSLISNTINAWANTNLNQFNASFKVSKLLRAIDDADTSITGSSTNIFIEKRFDPVIGVPTAYTLTWGTPLMVGIGADRLYSSPSFTQADSTGINRQCYIEETPESSTGIDQILIIQPGSNYVSAPTLTILGDGTGANAHAIIVNGSIQSLVIDIPGANYTTAQVNVTGGGGSGAKLQAIIQGSNGVLRSFYFDNNNIKTVLNANAGTIDYLNGIVLLTNFAPTNVANFSQTLSIHAMPATDNFGSVLNRILTYDSTDPGATTITLNVDTSA